MAKLIGTFRDLPHKLHLSGGGKAKASDKQLKQYREFFDLGELCKIGFPENASTLAHDQQLNLLAVGTKTGEIHVFGAPGHEFSSCHKEASEVKQLLFLPEEGRLVSLTADNRLHKWELNAPAGDTAANWRLEHVSDLLAGPADGADGQTAACLALVGTDRLWVGYASGSVRLVDAKEWKFSETATSGEAIAKSLTEEASSQIQGWGAVVAMEANPTTGKQVAVGYATGTVAVLNTADCSLHSLAPGSSELRCLNWQTDGAALYSGHADGSYAVWRADEPAEGSRLLKTTDNPQTVYGPFPCLPVTRLVHRTAKLGSFTVLAGGMAKNTHADRHTVTLLREQEHVCLDFCSPVVDVTLLCSPGDGNTGQAGYDEPHTLLVLCESQLVALDLYGPQWPEFHLPYMTAVTATGAPVTAARLYGPASDNSTEKLRTGLLAARAGTDSAYTSRAWPITGGKTLTAESEAPAVAEGAGAAEGVDLWDLLVTGHEDGSVAFWQVGGSDSGTSAALLYTLQTAELFSDAPIEESAPTDAGGFPPFRSVGQKWRRHAAENVADGGRFAVTAVELAGDCVLVGGAAGQATLWRLAAADAAAPVEVDVRTVNADIVVPPGKDSKYTWEGQAPLRVREDPWNPPAGRRLFEPATIALAFPPDRVCSLAFSVGHGLAALGTGFGLALLDTHANRCLATHCTMPQALTAAGSAASASAGAPSTPTKSSSAAASGSGGSSITKSLRQSFRRLKKLRGGKRQEYTVTAEEGGAAAGPSTSAAAAEVAEDAPASADKKKKDKKEKEKKDKKDKKEDKKTAAAAAAAAAAPAEEKAEEKQEEKKDEEEKAEEVKTEEKKEEEPAATTDEAKSSEEPAKSAEVEEGAAATPAPEPLKQSLTPEVGAESTGRVRCLLIADAHLLAAGVTTPSIFAGDRAGRVYAFQVEVTPPASGESTGKKQARLAKELHLRHGAPVVAMHVTGEQQQLVVASEQQVKLFSLPSLRPRCKARLLPAEAPARLRACGLAQFQSGAQHLTGLTVEDSLGRLLVLGLPQLKILAQLDRADQGAASAGLAFQPAGAANPLAVAVAGHARVRLVRLAAAPQQHRRRYVSPAGLDLPEWARPVKTPAAAQAANASATASPAAAATDTASAEASPAVATAEADHEQQEHEHEHEIDRSHHQVAADITMDDIKEYAAAAPLPPTETIPESTDEKQDTAGQAVGEESSELSHHHDDQSHHKQKLESAEEAEAESHEHPASPSEESSQKRQSEVTQEHPVESPAPAELQPAEVKGFDDSASPTAGGAGDIAAEQ